ncbi:MAG: DUF4845 domain-containing protein [Ectothiorhodospiraceae bacterium]|nr:DUF4845 domain-containing protein [Ectothiorhodospiraceae bacterium]MCH8503041.1 DUF4845 domain-containing protein [Ectothiorhodospiraceae bacterium]
MNAYNSRRQEGASAIGVLVLVVVLLTGAVIGMRLVPLYLESMEVGSILNSVANDPEMQGANRNSVREAITRRLNVNAIDRVGRSDIEFSETRGGLEVVIEYEARVHMIGNLDAVAKFRKEAVVPQ